MTPTIYSKIAWLRALDSSTQDRATIRAHGFESKGALQARIVHLADRLGPLGSIPRRLRNLAINLALESDRLRRQWPEDDRAPIPVGPIREPIARKLESTGLFRALEPHPLSWCDYSDATSADPAAPHPLKHGDPVCWVRPTETAIRLAIMHDEGFTERQDAT